MNDRWYDWSDWNEFINDDPDDEFGINIFEDGMIDESDYMYDDMDDFSSLSDSGFNSGDDD